MLTNNMDWAKNSVCSKQKPR